MARKLAIHRRFGKIEGGLRLNEDIVYKEKSDSIKFVDMFYMKFDRRKIFATMKDLW
jgi:hypothetical protein